MGLVDNKLFGAIDFNPSNLVPLNKFINSVSALSDKLCPVSKISSFSKFERRLMYLSSLISVSDELGFKEVLIIFKSKCKDLAIFFEVSSSSLECA